MENIICHIDNSVCDPDFLYVDVGWDKNDEKKINVCKTCPKREENYFKYLDDSIKYAENNPNSNIHSIRKIVEKYGGHFVAHGGWGHLDNLEDDEIGVLVAATSTLEDYYYVIVDKDLHVCYSSCVGKIVPLDELTEIPDSFSKLSKMLKNNKEELIKIIEESLNNSKYDRLITKINIF